MTHARGFQPAGGLSFRARRVSADEESIANIQISKQRKDIND